MDFSPSTIWHLMGPVAKGVVVVLALMSMYALAISGERLIAFRRGKSQSMSYIGALQPLVPGHLRDAVELHRRWPGSPVARVIGSAIEELVAELDELGLEPPERADLDDVVAAVGRTMDRLKERELANLRRGLPALATVSSSAPFVGLFGTVFGIITAFRSMADPAKAGGGIAQVSAGIAEALLTTAVGLAVAIVSVWFYNFFTARVDELTVDVDETAGEVLEGMKRLGRRRRRQ
jgi:biopolymer transport protein ExbB/TolQ